MINSWSFNNARKTKETHLYGNPTNERVYYNLRKRNTTIHVFVYFMMAVNWKNVGLIVSFFLVFVVVLYALTNSSPSLETSPQHESNQQTNDIPTKVREGGKPCCRRDERNLGPLQTIAKPPKSLTELQKQIPFVQLGGRWEPPSCSAPIRVAIVVAYRNRLESLLIFLNTLHPMLQKQHLDYQMFIVEQSENFSFNKGEYPC